MSRKVVHGHQSKFNALKEDCHPLLHDEVAKIRACLAQGIPL
jgi:hypothetical protein